MASGAPPEPAPTAPPVAVTGATGFTGGALAHRLLDNGHALRVLVRDPEAAAARRLAERGATLVTGDLTDADAVARMAEGADTLYHIGALFRTAGHPDSYYADVNEGGTVHVIEAAIRHGVRRTVHCSTVGVHGHVSEIPSDESAPYNPGDIYQVTKLAGEERFREAMAAGRLLGGSIFRPAGIYGPGDLRFLKVFRGVQRGRFPMFGSGEVTYHFTYIDDLVDGILLCGTHPDAVGDTFILGGDEFISLNDFVKLVADAVGGRPPRLHLPLGPLLLAARACETVCRPLGIDPPLHVRRCEFYMKARAFSNAKAKRVLGFQPKVTMADGVRRTAAWYAAEGLIGPIPETP